MSDDQPRNSIVSTAVDWLLIFAVSAVSLALLHVNPDSHLFSVVDLSISYSHRETPKVPLWLLIVLSVIAPTCVIAIVCLRSPRVEWRVKSRKLNHGLLGLGVSLGTATVILNIKNLAGKPRPDFLDVCQPNIQNIGAHTVGGYGQSIAPTWVMVDRNICTQQDFSRLNDGFRSFPSGYATIAFAGLWYLSLWLCEQCRLETFVTSRAKSRPREYSNTNEDVQPLLTADEVDRSVLQRPASSKPLPVYYLFLPYLPLGLAIFIAGTRYFDFRNHGIDVVAGAGAGMAVAYVGWGWYRSS